MASILLALTDEATLVSALAGLRAAGYPTVVGASAPAELRALLASLRPPAVVVVDQALADDDRALIDDVRRALRRTSIVLAIESLAVAPPNVDAVVRKSLEAPSLLKIVTDEVMRQIALELSPAVATVLAVDQANPTPDGIVCGGTAGLVALPGRRVLITAKHVVDGTRRAGVHCLLAGIGTPIDITRWHIIDVDGERDLATIAVPDDFNPESIGKSCFVPRKWPPERANRGDRAFFFGFAGIHRHPVAGGVKLHSTTFCDFVSSASERHFVLADEERVRTTSEFVPGLEHFGDTGGMSGAPVFIGRDGEYELCGVLYEGGDGADTTFFAVHADHLLPDGSIGR